MSAHQVLARHNGEVRIIGTFETSDRLEALELAAKEMGCADFAAMQKLAAPGVEIATRNMHPGDPNPYWVAGEERPLIQRMAVRRPGRARRSREEVPLRTRRKF